jgi:hypothetical protein
MQNIPKSAPAKSVAAKIAEFRKKAADKSLPQNVRNTFADKANALEQEEAEKAGVRFNKGGMVKKAADMKMMYGGMAKKPADMKMMAGGMTKKPMAYAKGGMAKCGASVPASQKGKK